MVNIRWQKANQRILLIAAGIGLQWAIPLQAQSPGSAPPAFRKYAVTDYGSIQEAIDANPGKMMYVPPGDYEISERIAIRHDGSGLYGYGRIIQTNPEEPILWIEKADNVRILDLTVTRPEGKGGKVSAVFAAHCRNLVLDGVQVLDTRAPAGAINIDWCEASQIRNCLVQNYRAIAIEDRTGSKESGYAYKAFDGTGIQETNGIGILIEGNRVFQTEYFPTPEVEKKYDMGRFVKKNAEKGALVSQETWDKGYTHGWCQGTAITINGSETSNCIQVLGNFVQNAFQSFDIQADQVILAYNITDHGFQGMKAMHGSRNTIVLANQFSKVDVEGVLLQPGVMSHAAGEPSLSDQKPDANVDGGSIVANNIVSDFGYGDAHWIYGVDDRIPFAFRCGQLPDDPPLRDVIVEGNIAYDPGRDKVLVDGKAVVAPPRYHAGVYVAGPDSNGHAGPVNVQFSDNIIHPGRSGVSIPGDLKP